MVLDALTKAPAQIFEQVAEFQREQLVYCHNHETSLKAIFGIHTIVLGLTLGGTRMWHYVNKAEAPRNVLRLSRGMTCKAATLGLNLGGGKAVIICDAKKLNSKVLLRKFGQLINNLNGKYITVEDVTMTTKDMEYVRMETKHVAGLPESMGGSGDSSPVTAYGTYMGMKAAAKEAFGSASLAGKRITVQDVDSYSLCALDTTITHLKCRVIVGCANNQLARENEHSPKLVRCGMVYNSDFLLNAGCLINVYSEMTGGSRQGALAQTSNIYDYILQVLNRAEREKSHPKWLPFVKSKSASKP